MKTIKSHIESNRFQDFYEEGHYLDLKNYLYNYLLRKIAVRRNLKNKKIELILEVGSGISSMTTHTHRVIYSDLSITALQILKRLHGKGWYVVADGMRLPFKTDMFSHTVSS